MLLLNDKFQATGNKGYQGVTGVTRKNKGEQGVTKGKQAVTGVARGNKG